jgi:adenine specific DNA methylase Mod
MKKLLLIASIFMTFTSVSFTSEDSSGTVRAIISGIYQRVNSFFTSKPVNHSDSRSSNQNLWQSHATSKHPEYLTPEQQLLRTPLKTYESAWKNEQGLDDDSGDSFWCGKKVMDQQYFDQLKKDQ